MKKKIRDTSQPTSLFYSPQGNVFAPEQKALSDEGQLRTVAVSTLPAGFGLLISLLSGNTIAGLLSAFSCHFVFSVYLVEIILKGVF